MRKLLIACFLLAPLAASATPGPLSYDTGPQGTSVGNPNVFPSPSIPYSMAFAAVAHLAVLDGAVMTSTADQPMIMLTTNMPPRYAVTSVYVDNCTSTPAGAVGGIYTAASKGGTAVVAASQTYAVLTTTTALQALTNNVATSSLTAAQLYFSLTTAASSGTPVCDIYVDGIGLQ